MTAGEPPEDPNTLSQEEKDRRTKMLYNQRARSAPPGDLEVPITSWPASISWGTSRVPIAPLAPATKTRMMSPFGHIDSISGVWCYDPTRRRNVTDG